MATQIDIDQGECLYMHRFENGFTAEIYQIADEWYRTVVTSPKIPFSIVNTLPADGEFMQNGALAVLIKLTNMDIENAQYWLSKQQKTEENVS